MRALQRLLLFVYLGNGFELLSRADKKRPRKEQRRRRLSGPNIGLVPAHTLCLCHY
jgi:hypothetical protein